MVLCMYMYDHTMRTANIISAKQSGFILEKFTHDTQKSAPISNRI